MFWCAPSLHVNSSTFLNWPCDFWILSCFLTSNRMKCNNKLSMQVVCLRIGLICYQVSVFVFIVLPVVFYIEIRSKLSVVTCVIATNLLAHTWRPTSFWCWSVTICSVICSLFSTRGRRQQTHSHILDPADGINCWHRVLRVISTLPLNLLIIVFTRKSSISSLC